MSESFRDKDCKLEGDNRSREWLCRKKGRRPGVKRLLINEGLSIVDGYCDFPLSNAQRK